jgi:thiol-disulfide isomerase/thioredoxin
MTRLFFILIIMGLMISVNGQYLKNLEGQPFSNEALQITLYNTQGDQTTLGAVLEKLKGNIVFIDIWASWCRACIVEADYTREIQKDYKESPIVYLFLSSDVDYKLWLKGLSAINLDGNHYRIDPAFKKTIQNFLKIKGIPYYVLLNKEGNIYDAKAPWPHLPKIRSELDMLLNVSK